LIEPDVGASAFRYQSPFELVLAHSSSCTPTRYFVDRAGVIRSLRSSLANFDARPRAREFRCSSFTVFRCRRALRRPWMFNCSPTPRHDRAPVFRLARKPPRFRALSDTPRRRAGAIRSLLAPRLHAGKSKWRGRSHCNDFSIAWSSRARMMFPSRTSSTHACAPDSRAQEALPIADIADTAISRPAADRSGPSFDWAITAA